MVHTIQVFHIFRLTEAGVQCQNGFNVIMQTQTEKLTLMGTIANADRGSVITPPLLMGV